MALEEIKPTEAKLRGLRSEYKYAIYVTKGGDFFPK